LNFHESVFMLPFDLTCPWKFGADECRSRDSSKDEVDQVSVNGKYHFITLAKKLGRE